LHDYLKGNKMIPIVNSILAWEKEIEIRDQKRLNQLNDARIAAREMQPQPKPVLHKRLWNWLRPQPVQDCSQPC
jgi:hypothetical protein